MADLKTWHFPGFKIRVPTTWTSTLDENEVTTIVVTIDQKDNFKIHKGNRSQKATNFKAIIVQDVSIEVTVDAENGGQIMEEKKIVKSKTFQSHMYPDIIGNRKVLLLIPKQPGQGVTGAFFEELNSPNGTLPTLSAMAINLKPENEKVFLSTIRTLTFGSEAK